MQKLPETLQTQLEKWTLTRLRYKRSLNALEKRLLDKRKPLPPHIRSKVRNKIDQLSNRWFTAHKHMSELNRAIKKRIAMTQWTK